MRGLTVQEPWCSAITYGTKRVENRTWATPYRGLLAVHAGRSVDFEASDIAWKAASLSHLRDTPPSAWKDVPLGAIIAVAELAGCHRDEETALYRAGMPPCSPWAVSCAWHWVLRNVRSLPAPVPCRGMLGLWRLPEDVEEAVRAQLETSHA